MSLGYPHPDYLLEILTPQQLQEWEAFYELEPWGVYRDDLRNGVLCSLVFNALRGKGSRYKAASDFVLKFGGVERQDSKQMAATMRAWAVSTGGKVHELRIAA